MGFNHTESNFQSTDLNYSTPPLTPPYLSLPAGRQGGARGGLNFINNANKKVISYDNYILAYFN